MKTRSKTSKAKVKVKVEKGKKGKTTKKKEIIYKAGDCIALNQEDGDNKFTLCILQEDMTDEMAEIKVYHLKTEDTNYYLLPNEKSRTSVTASTEEFLGPLTLQRTTDDDCFQLPKGMKEDIIEALGDSQKKEKLGEFKNRCNLEDFL